MPVPPLPNRAPPAGTTSEGTVVVCGSDTGVGKTFVTTRLVRALAARGERVAVHKPIESGCVDAPDGDGRMPADAAELHAAAGAWQRLDEVCPWRLAPPIAPAEALERAGIHVGADDLIDAAARARGDAPLLVCETAGGMRSPLAGDLTSVDLARLLDAPVLLVVRDRLGAIHQARVCLEVLAALNLRVLALVLNRIDGDEPPFGEANAAWIRRAYPELDVVFAGPDLPIDPLVSLVRRHTTRDA